MKHIHSILAAVLMSVVVVGCAGAEPTPGDEAEDIGDVQQGLPSCYYETTYYSNASKTTVVGWCYGASICSGPEPYCFGQKTVYYDSVRECC